MRSMLMVGVWLLGGTLAFAEAPPGDDDEKPGERSAPKERHRRGAPDENRESDTPPPPGETSAATPEPHTGGSRLRLEGRGDGGHSEGVYAGVTLGGQGLPPKAPHLPMKGPQRMTWPGFQVRDGVPTVFLQTTGTPNYAVTERGGTVVVTLHGTTIKLRNNQRPLRVGAFGTDVTDVTARPHGRDVVVTIQRKVGGPHRERVEPSAGGYQLLVVELPGK